jgi:hypothetical protein
VEQLKDVPGTGGVIQALVDVDESLAVIAVSEAEAMGLDMTAARKDLYQAGLDIEKGKLHQAILNYKQAWHKAMEAMGLLGAE